MARQIALLSVLLLISWSGYSQTYNKLVDSDSLTTQFWTIDDGLPINTVNQVVQDDDGYLWFTTYDGIVRFDGIEFETYNHKNTPQIPHNRATEIYKQGDVGIWISVENGGLLLIDDSGFQHFGVDEGFSSSDITQIVEDKNGDMFFVTHTGLYTYQDGRFFRFFEGKDALQNQTRFLFVEEDNSKWLSTNNGLIHIQVDGSFKEYNVNSNGSENIFFTASRTSEGVFLAGTTEGLFIIEEGRLESPIKFSVFKDADVYRIFDVEEGTLISSYQGLYLLKEGNLKKLNDPYRKENEAYRFSMLDSDGQAWLTGDRGTISIFRKGEIFQSNALASTGLDYFIYTFEDKEKNIWVTTPREGIIRLKKSLVKTIGKKEGLSEGNILGLLQDSRERYWVGTRGGGLNLIENNTITHFKEHSEIASSVVQSIAEDSVGNIWIGHYQKGLNRINDSGISHFSLGDELGLNNIHALYTASDGQFWIGSYGGLIKFSDKGEHTVYKIKDGLAGDKIRYITEARDGSLWIGTLDGGVSHFRNGEFKNYTVTEGLSSNNIRSLYLDDDDEDVVWIGTENNGLNRLKDGQITFLNTDDGLPNYNIHWISEDDENRLWLSSNNGIFRIQKESLNEYLDGNSTGYKMRIFGREEGMRNPEGNGSIQEAGIKDNRGSFWFATQEGVAIFEKDIDVESEYIPKVIIKDVSSAGESFTSESIIFASNIDDFEVTFHAITFVNPTRTRFRYKILYNNEEEKEWIEIGTNRSVEFSNMSPGEYKILAQATMYDGSWSDQTASVSVTVTPKYYQQIWFYLICIVAFSFLLVVGWKVRYQRLVARQNEMEVIIEAQLKELRQEKKEIELQKEIIEKQAEHLEQSNKTKDKFFSIIAHDLRNPFQALMGYTDYLYDDFDNVEKAELKESIGIIKDSSNTLLNLTENLLEWANLQTGKVKPEPAEFELIELIDQSIKVLSQSASQKNISISKNLDEKIRLYADRNMIDTVLRNLISNAIKFTPEGGEVNIKTIQNDQCCTILVSDTGIGIDPEMLKGVLNLDSKSTRSGTNNEAGTGLGLVLCKEMVEMNNGSLDIESKEGEGTTVKIILPSDKDAKD